MLGLAICLKGLFIVLFLQHSSGTIDVKEVVRILDDCPIYLQVMQETNDPNAFRESDTRILSTMRQLQPVPVNLLRKAINLMLERTNVGTPEYKEYQREMLPAARTRFPKFDEDKLALRINRRAVSRMYVVLWIDRYLFEAPTKEKSSEEFLGFVQVGSLAKPGYIDRLFPVEAVKRVPRLKEKVILEPPNGLPPQPEQFRAEFEYYAQHYARRKPWW